MFINYKNTLISLIITSCVISLFVSCKSGSIGENRENPLPALKIESDYISPEEGIEISTLRTFIIERLEGEGVRGEINSALEIKEITTEELWENNKVQLFNVNVEYAAFYGIAIVKDNQVLAVLKGMPVESVFIADLDRDNFYEVYINSFWGSGIIIEEISGYNIGTDSIYKLSKRMDTDFHLYIESGGLMVESKDYNNREEGKTGYLSIKKDNNREELFINFDALGNVN